jgi:hypothetical protein
MRYRAPNGEFTLVTGSFGTKTPKTKFLENQIQLRVYYCTCLANCRTQCLQSIGSSTKMKNLMAITAAIALAATAAAAQDTTQASVLGESGDPTYSLQVQGANGVIYNCSPDIETIDGISARRCVTSGGSGLAGAGAGLAGGPAIGVGVLALLAIAAGSDGSTSTTTTGSP